MVFFKILLFIVLINVIQSSESPGFFLKVSKNVPRIGRRSGSDFENFFLKQSKNVPRIGRRDGYVDSTFPEESIPSIWYQNYLKESKRALAHQSNDLDYDFELAKDLKNIQPIDEKFLVDILTDDMPPINNLRFVSWQDFDQALDRDTELYRKLTSLAKDKQIDDLVMLMEPGGGKIGGQYSVNKFVPKYGKSGKNDATYYRTMRSVAAEPGKNKNKLTQEQMAYNFQPQENK